MKDTAPVSMGAATMILWISMMIFMVLVPFTKVEESPILQAIHDLVMDHTSLDHRIFSGVVPRSVIPALMVAVPLRQQLRWLSTMGANGLVLQCIIRATVATMSTASMAFFAGALPRDVGVWLLLLLAVQTHVPYYASRTLPNTFALMGCSVAMGLMLRRRVVLGLATMAAVAAVVRCDVVVWFGPLSLWCLGSGCLRWTDVPRVVALTMTAIAISIPIDSLWWGRWVWPEAVVLFFNTIENRSHEWGVMPIYWYWTSALPRALALQFPLLLFGLATPFQGRGYCVTAFMFVTLYSFLPHKEVRFILPAIPVMTLPIAVAVSRISRRRAILGCLGMMQVAYVAIFLSANLTTYPGAEALDVVHQHAICDQGSVSVHIDSYAAMTGVTRFLFRRSSHSCMWLYDRNESVFNESMGLRGGEYDYLIARHAMSAWHEQHGYNRLTTISIGSVAWESLQISKTAFLSVLSVTWK